MSSIPEGSVLRPLVFTIFINNCNTGIKCTFRKFMDDINLCGAVNRPERRDTIQRVLDKLEPHEVQKSQVKGFASVSWQLLLSVQAGG